MMHVGRSGLVVLVQCVSGSGVQMMHVGRSGLVVLVQCVGGSGQ